MFSESMVATYAGGAASCGAAGRPVGHPGCEGRAKGEDGATGARTPLQASGGSGLFAAVTGPMCIQKQNRTAAVFGLPAHMYESC